MIKRVPPGNRNLCDRIVRRLFAKDRVKGLCSQQRWRLVRLDRRWSKKFLSARERAHRDRIAYRYRSLAQFARDRWVSERIF